MLPMNKPPIIDISRTISSQAVVYPGDDPLQVESLCSIQPDCPCNITKLGWTTHFLTHVDPPLHFVEDGASLDDIPISRFIGEAVVIAIEGDMVLASHLAALGELSGLNLLFKTRNSTKSDTDPFDQNHVYISQEAAEAAVEAGVNLVGIDYISVDQYGNDQYPAHRILLTNNVLILEGLILTDVLPGRYTVIALPLKIAGGDGSPVRAVLIPQPKE